MLEKKGFQVVISKKDTSAGKKVCTWVCVFVCVCVCVWKTGMGLGVDDYRPPSDSGPGASMLEVWLPVRLMDDVSYLVVEMPRE